MPPAEQHDLSNPPVEFSAGVMTVLMIGGMLGAALSTGWGWIAVLALAAALALFRSISRALWARAVKHLLPVARPASDERRRHLN